MARALVNVPKAARQGEVVEIRAMIAHPMETGYRVGPNGINIPRDIIRRFACTYNGEEVFSADLFPAVSANPFIAFTLLATTSGTIDFTWTDDAGKSQTASAEITVS
ncbi:MULTISPECIES: thiosulfate oxidation carrier complex protein SoxZ [unclassified Mesorhizobium]|uniref:thiosulfate oxidation carrier complex protein SoxZ n=1 Tax=unclassified Mesorhizobium TaxID=325217 RepID=UPI000F74C5C6|nr:MULTISPECIES: thiosulfate oxidation carrier complex protein SoxZ [unclassified Mesorhizobium]RUU46931.1 thiosulfate oxidation carrier complex protein SoxZ [Mesorhizobium sp. M6A.T.Ca.TU.002.02.2.1]AZO68380.1 thiosulfate oxidation carrier complex protein SoxZ [Mesorhizobium sp. M6A.T.Cr.TU.016.01.1.1]RWP48680.1 MAG: thiosulfate oxidation carrier complex protein SoxZ [Mesorhizobium sp.]RWP54747.1 MAG: thiosulfate oxidation carrier complex protein SoxZ [Mesorhizobium sp.]RWQ43201.1 MAG: thiosu